MYPQEKSDMPVSICNLDHIASHTCNDDLRTWVHKNMFSGNGIFGKLKIFVENMQQPLYVDILVHTFSYFTYEYLFTHPDFYLPYSYILLY